MKTKLIILCLGILLSACYKDRITADGNIKSEIRNLATFTEVHSSGSNKVHISYGTEYKIEVRGSGNLVSVFKTRVYNNKLSLGYERINVKHDDIEVFVTMPLLTELSLSGSGKADISGSFPDQENFNLRISGSADVVINNEFKASNLVIDISGSGGANMLKVQSKKSDVRISGSGDIRLTANELLKVSISGSGKVYYTGNAVVDAHISGSGKVIKL